MANKALFKSIIGKLLPQATVRNEAGGVAYKLPARAALAQYAATGCLNTTYYASEQQQLKTVLTLCNASAVTPEFIARVALYARSKGYMKDLPALLCAILSVRSPGLLAEVFDRVIDDGKMLRNFVQIMRSGTVGRKSLGTLPKRLVQQWFESRSNEQVFRASIGNDPSLADVIRMVHPKPGTPSRAALYGYLINQPHNADDLPEIVKTFELFKRGFASTGARPALPDVPFQLLTSLPLKGEDWKEIARNAPWQTTRMNLNTFVRHDVFSDSAITHTVAQRLCSETAVARAKVFPYQLLVAYTTAADTVPDPVRNALCNAMEIATRNVPRFGKKVFVCVDVSGSMHSAISGYRKGATSVVRCIDVAALIAACVLRRNRDAELIPFTERVVNNVRISAKHSIMHNAKRLSALPPGGTNCSAPLAELNRRRARGDLVIYVSDNESWVDKATGRGTATMQQWAIFRQRNPAARLACIDLQPYRTVQAVDSGSNDVMNIGGFTDHVFEIISAFAKGELNNDHWVGVIEQETL